MDEVRISLNTFVYILKGRLINMEDNIVMGIAYYKEKDWTKFLEIAEDREVIEQLF